ncbi:outer dense fiber protein 1 [Excalfactoria chinensis]|uniref:outer dense fiber protein 1 n=1 Tax=Excalfactoria chinensis TaxID=46218 RepID=UPI003B3B510D
MSLLSTFLEDHEWDFKQMERKMQRQMRLLDRHLKELREELLPCCPCSHFTPSSCLCSRSHKCSSWALMAAQDVERDLASVRRKLNKLCNACQNRKLLAVVDVKGFDPAEVTVTVKNRKVQVLAEHEEAYTTARGKEYNYKKVRKEIPLPPGVGEDEVMYSVGPNNVVKIEAAHKHCPRLLRI